MQQFIKLTIKKLIIAQSINFRHWAILFLLLIIFVNKPIQSFSQNNYFIQHFDSENGLPTNGVRQFALDSQTQFLWIATEGGLVRYDGSNFKTFNHKTNPSTYTERLIYLCQNKYNDIYFVNEANSLFKIKQNSFIQIPNYYSNKSKAGYFAKLFSSEKLFYGSVNSELNIKGNLIGENIASISDSSFLILDEGNLNYYNISKPTLSLNKSLEINAVSMFKCGEIVYLLMNDNSIKELHLTNGQFSANTIPQNKSMIHLHSGCKTFWSEGKKEVILLQDNNIYLLKNENNSFITQLICNNVPTPEIISDIIYSATLKSIFISTPANGLYILKQFSLIPLSQIATSAKKPLSTYAQIALNDSTVLTNTLQIFGTSKPIDIPVIGEFDTQAKIFDDSSLWYSANTNLYRYNIITKTNELKLKFNKYYAYLHMGLYKSNDTVFLLSLKGVYYFKQNKTGLLYEFTEDRDYLSHPYDIAYISPGIVLIGCSKGLVKYDLYNKKEEFILKTGEELAVRTIKHIGKYYFIGTYGNGMYIYDGKKIKALPLDKEKNLLYAHCFVPDNKGYCWISSNKGLYMALLKDMTDAFESDNISRIFYYHFGKEDGMSNIELNGGCIPCAVTLKNGIFSFPGMQGPVWVRPSEINPPLPGGKLFIDQITADKTIYKTIPDKKILLPFNTKQITIQLALLSWCRKDNIYLFYQLDNEEKEDMTIANEQKIILTNLSYGNHILRIYKLNGFGKNNYETNIIEFRIATPWFLQWWFLLLSLIAIILCIWFITYQRTRWLFRKKIELENLISNKTEELNERNIILQKNDQIKTRLISIISHDVVTPLRFLHKSGKTLEEKGDKISKELYDETLHEITTTSKELEILTSNILNWIKYQHQDRLLSMEQFNLFQVADQVIRLLKPISKEKDITLLNTIPEQLSVYQFIEPVKIIMYNLIMNAIQFTTHGLIETGCLIEDKKIMLFVKDSGKGISEQQKENILNKDYIISSVNVDEKRGSGLGYLIIRDLIKILSAEIMIESEINIGTTVIIIWSIIEEDPFM